MRVRAALAVTTVLAALVAVPAAAGAAAWDSTPLLLSPLSDHPPTLAPLVETTDDGASWVMWAEDPDSSGPSDVVVRRIDPNGIPGQLRVLTSTSPGFNGSIALAPLPNGDVRVAYISGSGAMLEERRLTPTSTGDPVVLYDQATTDDGDVNDNGTVSGGTVAVLAAPGGASWVEFIRMNAGSPVVSARRIADDDAVGTLAALAQPHYEAGAAVDPSGRVIIAVASGAQARGVVVAIETNGSVGSEVEIRPSALSSAILETPTIGIDAAGIATVGWVLNMSGRSLQARRVDTTGSMTPLGSGPVTLNDDVPVSYYQYAPLFGVDPGGDVVLGWYETDSSQDSNDAMARVLGDGAFADAGVVGPRLQLDGPSPEGAWVTDIVPEPAEIATVFSWTNARVCRASRIDLATKAVLTTDVIPATGCAAPVGPATGANGTVATWTEYPSWQVALSRYVTAAPACSDGAPATVEAGKSVTLALPCTGWRPQREVTGAPARGVLGAIDQDAGTVTYTAGADAGADQVRFRGVNGAGASDEHSVAITVTPAPVTPGGPNPPPPSDTTDRTPPVVTGLTLKPKRLSLRKLRPTLLGFSLSEPATVKVAVQRLVKGRRKGGRCVTKPRPRRGARCVKATTVKRLTAALPAGPGKLKITLRRPLSPGSYRVTLVASDQAGNISKALQVSLTIARR